MGGVVDESAGMQLDRDNYNFTATHAWTVSNSSLNQLSVQVGRRKFDEPNNSQAMAEYFSSGTTLPDRREHRRRPERHRRRSSRSATRSSCASAAARGRRT